MGVQVLERAAAYSSSESSPFNSAYSLPNYLCRGQSIRQTAPAHILGKHLLFLGSGTSVLLFQLEQGADGFNVPGIFLLCAALAQMVVRDTEVSGRLRRRFSIQASSKAAASGKVCTSPSITVEMGSSSSSSSVSSDTSGSSCRSAFSNCCLLMTSLSHD